MSADNAFRALTTKVVPPSSPVYSEGDWREIESRLHISLPDDYKQLIKQYGAGSIEPANLWLMNPFYGSFDLAELADLIDQAQRNEVEIPFAPYHPSVGLLPWARTGDGEWFTWNVSKDSIPTDWNIVVLYDGGFSFVILENKSVVKCLCELFDGTSALFPTVLSSKRYSLPQTYKQVNLATPQTQFRTIQRLNGNTDRVCYEIDSTVSICIPPAWKCDPVPIAADQHGQYGDFTPYFRTASPSSDPTLESVSGMLSWNSRSGLLDALQLRNAMRIALENNWIEYQAATEKTWEDWGESVGISTADLATDDLGRSGMRRFQIAGEGELSDGLTIPWLIYSNYRNDWTVVYCWSHNGEWRLEFFLHQANPESWKPMLDTIAQSVRFSPSQ